MSQNGSKTDVGTTQRSDRAAGQGISPFEAQEAHSDVVVEESSTIEPLTVGQAARILGIGEATVRKWADAGKLGEVVRLSTGDRLLDRNAVEQAAKERSE